MSYNFKNAGSIAAKSLMDDKPKLIHFIASHEGYVEVNPPRMSSEMHCPYCGCTEGYSSMVDPKTEPRRVWICGRPCELSTLPKCLSSTTILPQSKRALLWPLFCEINGIGDIHHNVCFEMIQQSEAKIQFLRKFAEKPKGIIRMNGDKGTGKTYCCMGVCELVTRRDTSVRFFTHKSLLMSWSQSFVEGKQPTFVHSLENLSLLVIDDFATCEPTPGFLDFFMHLINHRMQWTNKGTIITTNLDSVKMSKYCGEALSDRLATAQEFTFSGPSRRAPPPL